MWQGFRDPHEWEKRWNAQGLIGDSGGTVLISTEGKAAGCISWYESHWFGRSCWGLGIQLVRTMRHQGVGTRAHRLLVDYLFATTLPNRIEAYTEADNTAERRALEKTGFSLEGTLRSTSFRAGQWHDAVLYSVLRTDRDPETG